MSAFSDASVTEEVTITGPSGDENIVLIKAEADYGDQVYAQNRSTRVVDMLGKPQPQMDIGTANLAQMVALIVSWSGPDFTDEDGKGVKVTETNIKRLRPWASAPIMAAIAPKFQQQSDAEKKS